MSPASYLTAPPRVAGASIATHKSVASIAALGLLLWLALLLLVVSVTAGAAFVVLRALALWRSVKSFAAALENAVTALVATAARLTAEAEALGTTLPRVEQRVSRLQV